MWPDAEEKALQHVRKSERGDETDRCSKRDQSYALGEDQAQNVRPSRSQRHAQANLLGPLQSAIGHDAVKPDDGHGEPRQSEEAEQSSLKTRAVRELGNALVKRLHIDRHGSVDCTDLLPDPWRQGPRGKSRLHHEYSRMRLLPVLRFGAPQLVILRRTVLPQSGIVYVSRHSA